MSNPFEYVNEILQGKKNLIVNEDTEKNYNPFIINRSLSYHYDCVLYVNEMNRRHFMDKKMQNDFLINTVRSKRRPFVKWAKPQKNDDIQCIKKYFGYSDQKCLEALRLLNDEQIQQLKEKTDIGGSRK